MNKKSYSSYRVRKKGRKKKTPYMSDSAQTAKIKKLEKQVKANSEIFETKYLDTTTAIIPNVSSLNGTFASLTDIRPFQSSAVYDPTSNKLRINQRVGHKVLSQYITIQGEVFLPFVDPTIERSNIPCRLRMIFVQTLESLGGALIATDFLDKPALPMNMVDAFYKRNRSIKLRILKDVTYQLEPDYWNWTDVASSAVRSSGYTSTRPSSIKFNHKLTKYNKDLEWDATSATATTPVFGPIQMFVVADTPNAVEVTWHSRHVFKDQ